jgi:hypothetical protein
LDVRLSIDDEDGGRQKVQRIKGGLVLGAKLVHTQVHPHGTLQVRGKLLQ